MVTERDDYKMPPLFKGEYTPEILEKKKRKTEKANEQLKALKERYEKRKAAMV